MTGDREAAESGTGARAPGLAPAPPTRLRRFAKLTTRVVNPVVRLVAGRLPGLAIVTHVGRRTGRRYRTPVVVLRRGDELVIALGSGSDVDWVRNVVAAGGCELRTRGRTLRLTEPRIWVDRGMRVLPRPLRWVGSVIRLTDFLALREATPTRARAGGPRIARRDGR